MALSAEDTLRLNVLLANNPLAIRINESSMSLYGLLSDNEVKITLSPNVSDEKYLKALRSFLSEKALGSPGGYPLYLQRWTRQGQMRQDSLKQLLLLGDPTAVFAVVCSSNLTDELARRAWWASEEAENARRMLQTEAIVKGQTGKLLAQYLVDYLPFETETEVMVESVTMALQPGLLSEEVKQQLWKKSARKSAYLLGFLTALPDDLPEPYPDRTDYQALLVGLLPLVEQGNLLAGLLLRFTSSAGQTFIRTAMRILEKPPTQDVVNTTLDVIRDYCSAVRPEGNPDADLDALQQEAAAFVQQDVHAGECLKYFPALEGSIESIRVLSGGGYGLIRPVLGGSTAMGSLMRRKLEPVLQPYSERMLRLLESID